MRRHAKRSIGLIVLMAAIGCWADFPENLLPDGGNTNDGSTQDQGSDQGNNDTVIDVPDDDLPLGDSCVQGNQCASGNCVNDVCCDDSCTGPCEFCSGSGTCTNVSAGGDPPEGKNCEDERGTNPCGQDGKCDGSGSCRDVNAGTSCGTTECVVVSATEYVTVTPKCDGDGVCCDSPSACTSPPSGTLDDCGNYRCNGSFTACRTTCNNSNHCISGSTCNNPTCQ